jgi:8-oxo-dGTP pyrophosphatase MutT (NUDIX family)
MADARALADEAQEWPVHDVEDVWSGPAPFSVRLETISAPAVPDETFGRLVVTHPGAVVILAVDDEERAFVLRQYRHPARTRFVELPAGLLDVDGEDPVEAARRELQEEALLHAGSWTHLLTSYSSPGIISERVEVYLAEQLTDASDRGGFEPAHEEADMTSEWVPVSDLLDAVLDRRVTDGPTGQAVMAYSLLRARRG